MQVSQEFAHEARERQRDGNRTETGQIEVRDKSMGVRTTSKSRDRELDSFNVIKAES